ncbi:sugar phosphate isomerase/epimerase family protein [Phycicoccus sonneratiae]|uniref:Sugar phosphate isomerase/epimerase n=1 Tax=Phycicoccus sonneratiae TaxID=2807628 RepID=A0ABS2CN53_9MICO|nr:sugar phosphate isomerase/epimerase family protein [Phycicoccus sonneraticus]MBM6401315.1 sugar phosphate isomerase/epimerase [Phycicoccus sonneraticus]
MPTAHPELIATCWTSAGDASPLGRQRSPSSVEERVRAVAATGWQGLGLVLADLLPVRDTIGFDGLRELVAANGLRHTEVELVEDWWTSGVAKEESDRRRDLLLDAAVALGALHVKAGPPVDTGPADPHDLVPGLRALARAAGERGVRVALEPLPFSTVSTLPLGARLVEEAGVPNLGLVVDAWHVFRAGTSLDELADALGPGSVFAVELNDADPQVVGTLFEDTVHRRRYPGEGCFDLDGLVRVLTAAGFEGPWGVEMLSTEHRTRPLEEGLRAAHASATAVLRRALSA